MELISIRNMHENERKIVQDITLAAYEQYAQVVSPSMWKHYQRDILETLENVALDISIIAIQENIIVGSVLLYPANVHVYADVPNHAMWPEIRLLAVEPEARGQGIGRALMDECIQRARSAGEEFLGLHTADMMQVAQRMYEGMGFVRVPERDFRPSEEILVKGYVLRLV